MSDERPEIRLLLADVDGTLVTRDKRLTPAAIQAVRDLDRAGIAFAVTSGRPPFGMAMLVEPLQLKTPLAAFDGGIFANPDMTVIDTHLLEQAVAKRAVALIVDHGVDVFVYTEKDWFIRDKDAPHVAHEISVVKMEPKVVSGFSDDQLSRVAKITGVSDDPQRIAACEQALLDAVGAAATVARSQSYYLDATSPLANKGTVVLSLAKRFNLSPKDIATIGDMPNDIVMFAKSGFSIAMGNAIDEVKQAAKAVTSDNEHDGFAEAVRNFILPATQAGGTFERGPQR